MKLLAVLHKTTFAFALVLLSCTARTQSADPIAAGVYEQAERVVDSLLREEQLAGVSLSLLWPGMQTWHHAAGLKSRATRDEFTSHTPNAQHDLAQIYTAIAVLQLVEAGKVELDVPFQQYFPQFRPFASGFEADFTVRQLLSHHSGLPAYYAPGSGHGPFRAVGEGNGWRAALEHGEHLALVAAPGEVYEQSYLGYALLGLLIEQQSGERYEDYVRLHILAPLGLKDTYFTADPNSVPGIADAHDDGEVQGHERLRDVPATGLVSSAYDTATLLEVLLQGGGGTLLQPESVEQMFQAQNLSPYDANLGVGFGVFVGDLPAVEGLKVISQSAVSDGARTHLAAVPQHGIGVVLTTNDELSSVKLRETTEALLHHMLEVNTASTLPSYAHHPRAEWTPERIDSLLGSYTGPGGVYQVERARDGVRFDVPFLPFLRVALLPHENDHYGVELRLLGLNLTRFKQLQMVADGLEAKAVEIDGSRLWYWYLRGVAVATLTQLPPEANEALSEVWTVRLGHYESELSGQRYLLSKDNVSGNLEFGREGRGFRRWREAPELYCVASESHVRSCGSGLMGTATRNVIRVLDDGRLLDAYGVYYSPR